MGVAHLGCCGAVADVGGHPRRVDDIVEGEVGYEGVDLEEEGEGLADAPRGPQQRHLHVSLQGGGTTGHRKNLTNEMKALSRILPNRREMGIYREYELFIV